MAKVTDQLDDALGLAEAPKDLAALPTIAAPAANAQPTLDPALVGQYVGLPVASIGHAITSPVGQTYGDEMLSGMFNAMLARSGIADAVAPGGAISNAMAERMEAEMRAEGATDEDIATLKAKMASGPSDSYGWAISFTTGDSVSVFVCANDDDAGDYERVAFRWWQQHHDVTYMNRQRHEREEEGFFGFGGDVDLRVEEAKGTPYDTLVMGSATVARGATVQARVSIEQLRTKDANATSAAIAAIAIAAVEGYPAPGPIPPRPEGSR